tara:strand:+ start:34 stop:540 length:507 start_codon:yes stop_codon:yes gene_type:complete
MAINTPSGLGTVITNYDLWRLSTSVALTQGSILSNTGTWERADFPSTAYVGSGMTLSGGAFSFPTTGLWHINVMGGGYMNGNAQYFGVVLDYSTDNFSTHTQLLMPYSNTAYNISNPHTCNFGMCNLDVTNTSTQKLRLRVDTHGTFTWFGNTNGNMNAISFMRFGDT